MPESREVAAAEPKQLTPATSGLSTEKPDLRQLFALATGSHSEPHPAALLQLQRSVGNAAAVAWLPRQQGKDARSLVDRAIASQGTELDPATRSVMETHLGADLSDVRVHMDADSAECVQAKAYTIGNDVVLHPDHFKPGTPATQRTLAHELTHVVQQRSGPVEGDLSIGGMRVSDSTDRFERAAERSADALMAARTQPATSSRVGQSEAQEDPDEIPGRPGYREIPESWLEPYYAKYGRGEQQKNESEQPEQESPESSDETDSSSNYGGHRGQRLQRLTTATTALGATPPAPCSLLVQRDKRDKPATDSEKDMEALDYDSIMQLIDKDVRITYKNIAVQPNGELFIEFRETKPKSDNVMSQVTGGYSYDEKLHVPATVDDIAIRTNIVTRLCLERGFTSFKTTRPEKLSNVQSGAPIIWQMLKDGNLTDDEAYNPELGIQSYLREALNERRHPRLLELFKKHGESPKKPAEYGQCLSVVADHVVADRGIFPSEQCGREITIYVDPGFKPEGWWAAFAKELVSRMEAAGLPRLPIADGDQKVVGEGENVDGSVHAYFSSRDEGMAMDTTLDYFGFPIWYGGNAQKSRSTPLEGQQHARKLVFDMDLNKPEPNEPGLDVEVNPNEHQTVIRARVKPSKRRRFANWLKKLLGLR